MNGHTPGPWMVASSSNGFPDRIVAPAQDDMTAGIVGSAITRHRCISFPSSPEGQANARLIAAAPDILHELKRLVAALEPLERSGNWPLDSAGIATLNAARAAIAAAEGAKP